MLRRAALACPLLVFVGCAQPIDPDSIGEFRMRDVGGAESNNNNTPEEDTGKAPPVEDDTGTTPAADSAPAPMDGGTPDSATPDTATPDTAIPDTAPPGTGPADTGPPPGDSGTGTVITFPILTDTYVIKYDPNFWNAGDSIQGSRTTALPSITSISGTVGITNSLSACGAVELIVSVNGKAIGTVKITNAHGTAVPLSLTFPAATGPTYVIRYQAGNTVKSLCGAITFVEDSTKLTLK